MKKQNQLARLISEKRYYEEKEIPRLCVEISWYNENQTAPYPPKKNAYCRYSNQAEQALVLQRLSFAREKLSELESEINKYAGRKNGRK